MTEYSTILITIFFTVLLGCLTVVTGKRLFFHPLSSVPGPKLAALSRGYELYYDLIKRGRLPWKIQELHQKYGPVIRLAPDEVHISDPAYASKHFMTKADKYAPHQHRFGFPEATSETIDRDLHRIRYAALSPVFSKRAVSNLEPVIVEKVEKVCQRLAGFLPRGASEEPLPVNVRHLFLCMTTDTLTAYAFPSCFNLLDDPKLAPDFHQMLETGLRSIQWFKHFPILWDLMRSKVVSKHLGRLVPGFSLTRRFEANNKRVVRETIEYYKKTGDASVSTETGFESSSTKSGAGRSTVFQHLLNSDLPQSEKSFERLWQEGASLMGAGTETVANMLTFILVHLHHDQTSLAKLRKELVEAMPDDSPLLPWAKLETLSYLSAVISEGLRMALPVIDRILRVLPADAVVRGYMLPAGTVVGMSAITLHMDESIWQMPHRWMPERFLSPEASMRKNLYSFSKGPRACAGMNLAYAQLYITLAAIIRRFDLQLFETSLADVEPNNDGIVALAKEGSKVQMLVLGAHQGSLEE